MRLPFDTDIGWGEGTTLGVIVLQADVTIEPELRAYTAQDNVVLYHSRVPSAPEVTPETLARMETELPAAVRLLPDQLNFDVIGYGCTSGAIIIGADKIAQTIRTVKPGVRVTDPITAVTAALRALDVKRIGFVTPYIAEVSAAMRQNLETAGFEIAAFGSFEQIEEQVVARIDSTSVRQAILDVGTDSVCDAVFVSCTNLRTRHVIPETEIALGRPVISSNQALAWHMLRLAGIEDGPTGCGQLMRCPL